MIKSKLNNGIRIVQVTHIRFIHDFSIVHEKDLRWSNELKSQLNQPELLSAARMFQDKVSLNIGVTLIYILHSGFRVIMGFFVIF